MHSEHNVSLSVSTLKSLLIQALYFLRYSMTFFAKCQHALEVLIHVAPCSVLCCHKDKICTALLVALCSSCVPKTIEFCRYIQLLQAKMKDGIV